MGAAYGAAGKRWCSWQLATSQAVASLQFTPPLCLAATNGWYLNIGPPPVELLVRHGGAEFCGCNFVQTMAGEHTVLSAYGCLPELGPGG